MICPNCKKEIPDDSLFCGYCGTTIPKVKQEYITCPKCGEHMPPDSMFCTSCGCKLNTDTSDNSVKLVEQNVSATQEKEAKSKKPTIIIIGTIIVILLICAVLVPSLSSKTVNSSYSEADDASNIENNSNLSTGDSQLSLIDSGFTYVGEGTDYPSVNYGFEYKNTGSATAVGTLVVKVTSKNSEGGVISVDEQYEMICLPAGETAVFGASTLEQVSEKPSEVTIDIDLDESMTMCQDWDWITVDNARLESDEYSYSIVGEVQNDSSKTLDKAMVFVIFKNDDGKIIGGGNIMIDALTKGKCAFQGDLWDASAESVSDNLVCSAYGYLW